MAIPYFPFYPNDWRSDPKVAMLSLEERGAYLEVMCLMWVLGDDDGRIPDDDQLIVRQIHLHMSKWRRIKRALVDGPNAVLTVEDGFIYQKRLQKERRKAGEKSEVNRKNIEARWAKNEDSERDKAYDRNTSVERSKYQSESESDIERGNAPLPPADEDLSGYDLPVCRDLSQFRLTAKHYHVAAMVGPDVDVKAETVLARNAWKRNPPRSQDLNALWLSRIAAKQKWIRQDREKAAATAHEEVSQMKPMTVPDYGTWILTPETAGPRPAGYPDDCVPVSTNGFVQWYTQAKVPKNARPITTQ